MPNPYYTFSPSFTPGTKVRADAVNLQFAAIETAFDNLSVPADSIVRGISTFGVESQGANVNQYEVALDNPRTVNQEGDEVVFKATHTNTGATMLNVDGIGAVPFVAFDGDPMTAGALVSGLYYEARYDNTNTRFMLMSLGAESLSLTDLSDVSIASPVSGQVITYSGGAWVNAAGGGGGGGGGGVDVQTFTVDGTWTKPAGAGIVEVYAVGGGGGGGSGRNGLVSTVRCGGGGGQGAGISFGRFSAAVLGNTEPVTVAIGGVGGASQTVVNSGVAGANGEDSVFGTAGLVIARGGDGGTAGTTAGTAAGGTGLGAGDLSVGLNGGQGDDITGGAAEAIQYSTVVTTQTAELLQCGGGGGAGGVTAANAAAAGGDGSLFGAAYSPEQLAWTGQNGATSTAGSPGGAFRGLFGAGGGGGGGGGSITANAGNGGLGGTPGGGGGGGGGVLDTAGDSGAGGNGGPGVVVVVTYLVGSGGSFTVVGGTDSLKVREEGVAVGGSYDTLNFIGSSVTAVDAGGGVANITVFPSGGGGGSLDIQIFTSNGTWTKPPGAALVTVFAVGGGSGGGGGRKGAVASARAGGTGGQGGGTSLVTLLASDLGASESVSIGLGAAGGAGTSIDSTSGSDSTTGGNSQFGTVVFAEGGEEGRGGGTGGVSGPGTTGPATAVGDVFGALRNGLAGGSSSVTAAGGNGQDAAVSGSSLWSCGGGGGGGGVNTADTSLAAGRGSAFAEVYDALYPNWGGAAGSAEGAFGGNGTQFRGTMGCGGGGGGGRGTKDSVGSGGDGGDGAFPGGAGGGGGACVNDSSGPNTSGSGGAGANGVVVVITSIL